MGLTPPPLPPVPLGIPLAPLLVLIENLVFKEQRVVMDGYRFKNCAFVDCTMVVRRGNFKIEECFLQGTWWCVFEGNAQRVTKLGSILDWTTVGSDLKAVLHENGGISIT